VGVAGSRPGARAEPLIAALFVQADGIYAGVPGIDLWPEERDARRYDGPLPIVAHPPCQRWGRYWHGSPRKPHQFRKGDDGGCFASALAAVRRWGGVLEHPAYSHAWLAHGLPWPPATGGWQADVAGGWCCHVEQGHYGHSARKPTWLYAVRCELPDLIWGSSGQRLDPRDVEKHGRAKAARIGIVAHLGGGGNATKREATPASFRDVLLAIAAETRP
jgi:hypothetical protein